MTKNLATGRSMNREGRTPKTLATPHNAQAAKPGIGSTLANARTIKTMQTGKGMRSSAGVSGSYFGNSRQPVHPKLVMKKHD